MNFSDDPVPMNLPTPFRRMTSRLLTRCHSFFCARQDLIAALLYMAIIGVAYGSLLAGPGFYAYGDSDFPIRHWPMANFLPFDWQSNLGYDNVFIGLPRVLLLLYENAAFTIFHSTAWVSFALYVSLAFGSMWGSNRLLRRLGVSSLWAFAGGLFYTLNPWIASRISQINVVIVYLLAPVFYLLLLDLLRRPRAVAVARLSLIAPALICAINMTYIAVVGAAIIVIVHQINDRRDLWKRLAGLFATLCFSCLICAFFLFPALAEAAHHAGGALTQLATRYSFTTYQIFAGADGIPNLVRYEGFMYAPWRSWPTPWQMALFLLPLIIFSTAVCGLIRFRTLSTIQRTALISGLGAIVLSVFLTTGAVAVPWAVQQIWNVVPGLKVMVDADYWAMLYSIGALLLIAAQPAVGRWTVVLGWSLVVGASIVLVPFLPQAQLFSKAAPPSAYYHLPQTQHGERTLWEPQTWVNHYAWSQLMLSGWPTMAVPGPSFGPYTTQITPSGSYELSEFLQSAFSSGKGAATIPLLSATRTRYLVLTEDKVNDPVYAPYLPDEAAALNRSFDELIATGTFIPVGGLQSLKAPLNDSTTLPESLRWYVRYRLGASRLVRGSILVGSKKLPLAQAINLRKWVGGTTRLLPIGTRFYPSAESRWYTGFCDQRAGGTASGALVASRGTLLGSTGARLRCASMPLDISPGITVFTIPVKSWRADASASIIVGNRRYDFHSEYSELTLTLAQSRAQTAVMYVYIPIGRSGKISYGRVRATEWPDGTLEILGSNKPIKSIQRRFNEAEDEAKHVRILQNAQSLTPALYVARRPISGQFTVKDFSTLASHAGSDAVLSQPSNAIKAAEESALSSSLPALRFPSREKLILQYIPGWDGNNRGVVQSGPLTISLDKLLTPRAVTTASLRLLPVSSIVIPFRHRDWTIGFCDNLRTGSGSLRFSSGTAFGMVGSRTWCISRTQYWGPGLHLVSVQTNFSGVIPRGAVETDAGPTLMSLGANGSMTAQVELSHAERVQIFLYMDAGSESARLRYSAFREEIWPTGALLARAATQTASTRGRLSDVTEHPLGFTAVLRSCERGCVIVGNWSYSPLWEATAGGRPLNHVPVNIYSNAWIVPAQSKSIPIDIHYAVSNAYYAGLICTGMAIIVGVLLSIGFVQFRFRRADS